MARSSFLKHETNLLFSVASCVVVFSLKRGHMASTYFFSHTTDLVKRRKMYAKLMRFCFFLEVTVSEAIFIFCTLSHHLGDPPQLENYSRPTKTSRTGEEEGEKNTCKIKGAKSHFNNGTPSKKCSA